jgi:hypothetical protein
MVIFELEDGLFTLEPVGGLLVFLDGRFVTVGDGEGTLVVVRVPNGRGSRVVTAGVVEGARVSITVESVVMFIGR